MHLNHLQGHGSGDKRNIMESIVKVDENYIIKDFLSEAKYRVTYAVPGISTAIADILSEKWVTLMKSA